MAKFKRFLEESSQRKLIEMENYYNNSVKVLENYYGKEFFTEGFHPVDTGFFISPSKEIIPIQRHIDDVITNPDKYKMTKQMIQKIYKKYKEPIGQEGKAREEILTYLVKNDWIRIRYYQNKGDVGEFWSVNVNKLNNAKDRITEFFQKLVKKKLPEMRNFDKYAPVHIIDFTTGDSVEHFTVDDIAKYALFKKSSDNEEPEQGEDLL